MHGKVFVTRAMVERATVLGGLLNKALAHREIEGSPLAPNTDRRHLQAQAFTVFARAYNETRRGVSYLRWHEGDAHLLVPSLYPHRPRRSGTANEDPTSDAAPEPITDAEPEPTPISEPVTAGASA